MTKNRKELKGGISEEQQMTALGVALRERIHIMKYGKKSWNQIKKWFRRK